MPHIVIPVLGFGRTGGYRVLSKLATEWKRVGHKVQFISHASSGPVYFPTEAEVLWVDDAGREIARPERPLPPMYGLGVFRQLNILRKALNRYAAKADAIIANHSFTAWPVWLARTTALKAYYIQAYEPEYYKGVKARDRILWGMAAGSYRLPLLQILNSPFYASYLSTLADRVVPPGIDLQVFHPKEATKSIKKPIVIGCIGRVEPHKGTLYVLQAFQELKKQGVPVQLQIAYGHLPEGISLPEDAQVVMPHDDHELAEFYRSLDVLIAPGLGQRGAPHYPVMEAMASRTSVITTGYAPATRANAYFVEERDVYGIVKSVCDIIDNPDRAYAKQDQALKDIEHFGWHKMASKFAYYMNMS